MNWRAANEVGNILSIYHLQLESDLKARLEGQLSVAFTSASYGMLLCVSPAQQLAQSLLQRRTEGLPFLLAWSACFDEIDWPADKRQCLEWRRALAAAREEFEDAYEHPAQQPTYVRRALARHLSGELTGAALARIAAYGDHPVSLLGFQMQENVAQ